MKEIVPRRTFTFQDRIKKKKEFEVVYNNGARCFSKNFLLIIARNTTGRSRLGITVTKKVDKRAVYRNLIKRRVREVFRLNRHLLNDTYDIVVVARQNAAEISYSEVQRQLLGALRYNSYLLPAADGNEST